MSKIAVVYWSGTGNTESMANKVADGAKAAGAEVSIFTAAQFDAGKVADYDAIAFGCPAMGAEQLGRRDRVRAHVQRMQGGAARQAHSTLRILRLGRR